MDTKITMNSANNASKLGKFVALGIGAAVAASAASVYKLVIKKKHEAESEVDE